MGSEASHRINSSLVALIGPQSPKMFQIWACRASTVVLIVLCPVPLL